MTATGCDWCDEGRRIECQDCVPDLEYAGDRHIMGLANHPWTPIHRVHDDEDGVWIVPCVRRADDFFLS